MGRDRGTIAVIGGHGKTGRAVIGGLKRLDQESVAVGRAQLADPGTALSEAAAIYLIAPNMCADEPGFVDTWLSAAAEAGVERVVYHSVAAPYAPQMPHHLHKAMSEDLVRRSGLDWTILQPCAYAENLLPGLREPQPQIRIAYSPDTPFGLIGLDDVGAIAARVLLESGHTGASYELGGPELVTVRQVARIAEAALGRPVDLRVESVDDWAAGPGAGLEARERDWLAAMFAYYDAHGLPVGGRVAQMLLGRRPESMERLLRRALVPEAEAADQGGRRERDS
ncbi:NmrA family NAD(P)-binding protein [Brevibacterium sp. 50QC2O2]|uniref:NmrA family NAD(P)-binding protein n=1 Tax=Brevibacterium sp. 50QC2O2 TaxID=2968459 RepID=UPI00211B9347|nr:NmrA family NAD(P)-binding protein [Brevibacterium sp. 50QC2O2]MCQ9388569.1 NmrA family NAD(P)-binding protein [Brevibacterium sp. 50QC2O2]